MSEDKVADPGSMGKRLHRTLLKTQSDARLVELTRAGHEPAFEEIAARYAKPLQRYCRRLLSDSAAEDAVQQALISAWSALAGGTEVRDLRPWLYRIAHNAMLRIVAKDGDAGVEVPEWLAGPDTPALALERSADLRATLAAVADLPERQREALVATALHGRSREEMAGVLGMTESAVRQLVHRARVSVRAAATAVVPMPLFTRLLGVRNGPEIATGAGAAGAAAAVKWATVLGVTGALIAGPAVTRGNPEHDAPAGAIAAAPLAPSNLKGPAAPTSFTKPPAAPPLRRNAPKAGAATPANGDPAADPTTDAEPPPDASAGDGTTDPAAQDPAATDPAPSDQPPPDDPAATPAEDPGATPPDESPAAGG